MKVENKLFSKKSVKVDIMVGVGQTHNLPAPPFSTFKPLWLHHASIFQ